MALGKVRFQEGTYVIGTTVLGQVGTNDFCKLGLEHCLYEVHSICAPNTLLAEHLRVTARYTTSSAP